MARRYAAAADQAQGLTTQGKNLLRTLADNCNEEGRALPVAFGWAGIMNISARTYQRAMKELVDRRLVEIPPAGSIQIVQLYLDDTRLAIPADVLPAQVETEFNNVVELHGAGPFPPVPSDDDGAIRTAPELPHEASEPQDDVSLPVGDGITDDTAAIAGLPQTDVIAKAKGDDVHRDNLPDGEALDSISGIAATTGGSRLLEVAMAFHSYVDADAINLAAQAWADIEAEESKPDGDGRPAILDLVPQIIHAAELAHSWREAEDPGSLAQWLEARQYLGEQYQCAPGSLHPSVRPVVNEAEVMQELSGLIVEMGPFFKTMRLPNEPLEAFDRRVRQKYKVFAHYKSKTGENP